MKTNEVIANALSIEDLEAIVGSAGQTAADVRNTENAIGKEAMQAATTSPGPNQHWALDTRPCTKLSGWSRSECFKDQLYYLPQIVVNNGTKMPTA